MWLTAGIAHYVYDHENVFREIVEQFAEEYLSGRTPVPALCNMGPKFTDLFRWHASRC